MPCSTVVPTLVQEAGPNARPVEDKRAELAALPTDQRLSADDVEAIREIGDNTGSMALKGANPAFEGDERPDGWSMSDHLSRSLGAGRSTRRATSSTCDGPGALARWPAPLRASAQREHERSWEATSPVSSIGTSETSSITIGSVQLLVAPCSAPIANGAAEAIR